MKEMTPVRRAVQTLRLRLGDSFEVLKTLEENSIGAVVCDPPYGLEFMGKDFDTLRFTWRNFAEIPIEWVQEYEDVHNR